MKLSYLFTAVIVVAFVIAGCSKKSKNANNEKPMSQTMQSESQMNEASADNSDFAATLSGTNEVPEAVQTDAGGEAFFKVSNDSTEIYYTVNLTNTDSVRMAHIHYGSSSDNGPIAVWLYPGPKTQQPSLEPGAVNGTLKKGVITDSDLSGPFSGKSVLDLVHAMENDSAYVQVHTVKHPEGEIRGQIQMK